jgi:hypothetical protein
MKKTFLSAIALCVSLLLLNACAQRVHRFDGRDLSSPEAQQQRRVQRPAAQDYPDDNRGVDQGAVGTADSPGSGAVPGGQDYINMPEEQAARTPMVKQEGVLPSMTYVNERLAEYGKKLDRWRELDRQSSATAVSPQESAELISCFQQLQKVMNGYSALRANMLDNAATKTVSVETARDLYKTDIDFLESRCGLMLTEKPPAAKIADSQLQATGDTLLRNYAAGNYAAATQLWQALPAEQGVRLRVSAQNAAAQAMLRQGDDKGASAIYKNLLQRLDDEDSPDTLELRRRLADIAFAAGNSGEALRQYRQMGRDYKKQGDSSDWANRQMEMIATGQRDQQGEYASLMRRWLLYVPDRDGLTVSVLADNFLQKYPQSPVAANVVYIRDDTKAKAERWINGRGSAADKLVARKKFQETARLVNSAPANSVESEQQSVPGGSGGIGSAQAAGREIVTQEGQQALQRRWNNASLLAQNGRYDEAIAVFTELEGTDMAGQAKDKVRELSLQAAQNQRRKAADLYQRYLKTRNIEEKKKLLLESRRILKDILAKYPDVEIAPRVSDNIARVEQEIRSVDPNLLEYTSQPGQAPPADGADGGQINGDTQ